MEPAIICRSTSPVIVCQGFQDQAARVSIKEETVDAKKNFGLSSLVLFLLLLPPSPCPSFPQSISPTSPFLLLLLPPHPPPPPSTPYYKFSPSTPSPSSPLFLLRLLLFLPVPSLSLPCFSSSSSLFSFSVMSASFSSFFHYLLHYPPSHLSSSPLISTVSFCFSHFPIFFVSLILFEFPLFFCLEVDYCYDSPCLNNGTCRSLLNNYTCACTEQFQGKNCEG